LPLRGRRNAALFAGNESAVGGLVDVAPLDPAVEDGKRVPLEIDDTGEVTQKH
jgi:hypothetical protein